MARKPPEPTVILSDDCENGQFGRRLFRRLSVKDRAALRAIDGAAWDAAARAVLPLVVAACKAAQPKET